MKWFEKIKKQPWFTIAAALCIAVLLFFVLQNLATLWTIIQFIWNIISPLVLGVVFAYIIDPLVRLWERTIFKNMKNRGAARGISVAISIILILAFIVALLYILIPQLIASVETLMNNIGDYMQNLEGWLRSIGGGLFSSSLDEINFSDIGKEIVGLLGDIVSGEQLITTGINIGTGAVSVVISLILAIYFMLAKGRLIVLLKKVTALVVKQPRYGKLEKFAGQCNRILVRYICCTLLDALIVGVANAILMAIFGMPYIPIISLTVGVTNLAPTFGPIAGGAAGAFILLMINPWWALLFIIFTVGIQIVDAYILKPRLFAGQLGISPVLTLVSIIVFGRIFGVVGMLLAIPIAAILQYLVEEAAARKARKDATREELDETDRE